jgi:D-alanyl-D-alanine endopeptidase (penicillin-binding protein 7)
VNRTLVVRIGSLALVSFVGIASIEARATEPQAKTTEARSATAKAEPAAKPAKPVTPVYSATRSASRKSALARARAAAAAREMADTVLPRYKVDASGDLVPDVRAAAAIIYDPETKQVIWEENSQSQRSIASITKVMTAIVFLENNPDLSQPVTVARSDVFRASTTRLRAKDKVTTDDLLHLLLIGSDNAAARALARVSPQGSEGFVRRMNERAAELGLESTGYADPAGLLSDNLSSAFDMARLITHASGDDRIASVMRLPEYTVRTAQRRILAVRSTNHLLGSPDVDVRAGKTGFISRSGYCLATLLRLPESGQQFAVVVLGARSNAGRFMETRNLLSWLSAKASTLLAAKAPVVPQQQE